MKKLLVEMANFRLVFKKILRRLEMSASDLEADYDDKKRLYTHQMQAEILRLLRPAAGESSTARVRGVSCGKEEPPCGTARECVAGYRVRRHAPWARVDWRE